MPNTYRLNLDCSSTTTTGDFNKYLYTSTPVSYPNNPKGQVWWKKKADGTWEPAPGNPGRPGNPQVVSPVLTYGDSILIAIRDTTNTGIDSVQVSVIFGRNPGKSGQAPVASPFERQTAMETFNLTTLGDVALADENGEWFEFFLPPVSYPTGGNRRVNFTCYIGAVVLYADGSERQFGLDPEMEVLDYGPGGHTDDDSDGKG